MNKQDENPFQFPGRKGFILTWAIVLSSLLNDAEVCGNVLKTGHKINDWRLGNYFLGMLFFSFYCSCQINIHNILYYFQVLTMNLSKPYFEAFKAPSFFRNEQL